MEAEPFDRVWRRSRTSMTARVARLRSKWWQIGAVRGRRRSGLVHRRRGRSATRRRSSRRSRPWSASARPTGSGCAGSLEVTIGVALGVFLADLLVARDRRRARGSSR